MEYGDFFDIASYANAVWKGSFTPKEVSENAFSYYVDFEWSKKNGQISHRIEELIKKLTEDGGEDCKYWLHRITEELKIKKKEYVIRIKCWDYPSQSNNKEKFLMYKKNEIATFTSKEAAMVVLLSIAIEELNTLNSSKTHECKKFIPDLNGDHDCIIRAWDEEDYINITSYDVIERDVIGRGIKA